MPPGCTVGRMNPTANFPRWNSNWASVSCCGTTSLSSHWNLGELKDLQFISCCQIPQGLKSLFLGGSQLFWQMCPSRLFCVICLVLEISFLEMSAFSWTRWHNFLVVKALKKVSSNVSFQILKVFLTIYCFYKVLLSEIHANCACITKDYILLLLYLT